MIDLKPIPKTEYIVLGNCSVNIAVIADENTGECSAMICDRSFFEPGTFTDATDQIPLSKLPMYLQTEIMRNSEVIK